MRQTIIIVRFAVDVARLQNQVRFARLLTEVHQAFNVVERLCRIWWVGHQNVILWRCFGSDTGIEVFAFVIHVWEAASSKLIFHTACTEIRATKRANVNVTKKGYIHGYEKGDER